MSNNKYEQTTCPICCETLYDGDTALLTIKCKHIFHLQCIKDNVAANNPRCPLCQQDAALSPLFEIPQPAKDQQSLKDNIVEKSPDRSIPMPSKIVDDPSERWTCTTCTLNNVSYADVCDVCQNPRAPPTWECSVCTFQNIDSNYHCEICGEGKKLSRHWSKEGGKPCRLPDFPDISRSTPEEYLPKIRPSPAIDIASKRDEFSSRPEASVYIPDLPADIMGAELERMIDTRLNSNHHIHVNGVKCHSNIGVGMIYVSDKNQRETLLNTIQSIVLDPRKNITISFVEQIELISYVVFDQSIRDRIIEEEVARRWAQLSRSSNKPPSCEQPSMLFPNVFKIISHSLDELFTMQAVDVFRVNDQLARVYIRANCSFFEDLPHDTTVDQITAAISAQIGNQHAQQTLYVQYKKEASSAIVLAMNAVSKWSTVNYISLNSKIFTKRMRLAFRIVIHKVSSSLPIELIVQHRLFQNAITKYTRVDEKLIIELNDKLVYDQCLHLGALRVNDCTMHIDPYTIIAIDPDNSEINAENWYETRMLDIEPDITQFVVNPQDPIFKYKWNDQHWLKQFQRIENKYDRESNRTKYQLRVTAMLNTIGVVSKKSYMVEVRNIMKTVKLEFQRLKTIVYNHRSKLALSREVTSISPPPFPLTTVEVVNDDCLVVYTKLLLAGNRPVVLNMANATTPGGGYRKGVGAQEEDLFRRSDYYLSLDAELDETNRGERYLCTEHGTQEMLDYRNMYPMDEFGAIYTSGITVFRDIESKGYSYLEEPIYDVCAIALAAYQQPELKANDLNLLANEYAMGMRKKIENLFAITHKHGHDSLVLSALGCGASRNPAVHVAAIFKSVIQQYAGYFKIISFAIIDDHNAGHQHNPNGNYLPFKNILDGFRVQPQAREFEIGMASGSMKIRGKSSGKITIDDVCIFDVPPCRYGAECRELDDAEHCYLYSHPPLCPEYDTCDQVLKDDIHRNCFIHRINCKYGGQSNQPELCPRFNDCADTSKDHALKYRHLPMCKEGPIKCRLFLIHDQEHCRFYRHFKPNCQFGANCVDFHVEEHFNHYSHPFNQPCPWTPFLCQYYEEFLQVNRDSPGSKHRSEVDQHCISYSHVCPFGRQCYDKSDLHLRTSIHIIRKMCPEQNRCSKLTDKEHLNSYSHPNIHDIRILCRYCETECRDRSNRNHIIRYRHTGNDTQMGVVRYFGLNKNVNFVRNQYEIIKRICGYVQAEKWNNANLTIPRELTQWIRALQPIHRCNKLIFESIVVHGHVMSRDYMNLLREPRFVADAVEQHNQVRRIFDRHNNPALNNHGREFIQALVAVEFNKSAAQPANPYIDTINTNEVRMKLYLTPKEISTIRVHATNITQASLKLHANPMGLGYGPDETLGTNKHVFSILGPHLGYYYGDVFIIFKRELMFHPDTNFSIQAATTFGPSGNAYKWRPWLKDPGSGMNRVEQFHQNKLHCSVFGYDKAAAVELMALTGRTNKTMDINLVDVESYWKGADSHQVFEAHLPQLIPLDYIDHIYIPENVFALLAPSVQQTAKDIFRDNLTVTKHIIDLNAMKQLESTRSPYQNYVFDEIKKKIAANKSHTFQGTLITLPASKFEQHVAMPMTISQSYRYYQTRKGPSDTIIIYWQAMGGDMMLTVSNELINSTSDQKKLQCLVCYIAETPSINADIDYHESYSYISNHHPYHHEMIKQDRTRLKAISNSFYRGSNTNDYITYCLIIKKNTGQVQLTHAGSNNIYAHQTITYHFQKSEFDLCTLDYVHVSAGARITPVRNLLISHEFIEEYHVQFDKEFKQHPVLLPKAVAQALFNPNNIPPVDRTSSSRREPCPDSVNCLLRYSDKHSRAHNEIYSHPCRYSELCRRIPDHPHLEHKPHPVPRCKADKTCRHLTDPVHRAQYRHSELSDYLVPCRNQRDCPCKTNEHRIMYSHGEQVPLP